ncbi:hypothetical protein [Estrella lausannensis]|uniref:Putative TolA protein n=1 Tax=Estrella lausannensis TaxID=483423 RepID=A0A0H5DRQ9_9BACT|nr:hypothetical protein [Estrella lausannensis]CRX38908.1 Putative TolA protein [Estrella lausannensis]
MRGKEELRAMIPLKGPVVLRKDTSLIYISVFVILGHLFLGMLTFFNGPEPQPVKKKEKFLVKTVQLKEARSKPSALRRPDTTIAVVDTPSPAKKEEPIKEDPPASRLEEKPALPPQEEFQPPAPPKKTAPKEIKKESKKKAASAKKEPPLKPKPVKKAEPVEVKKVVKPDSSAKKAEEKKRADERLSKCLKEAKEKIAKIERNRDNVNALSANQSAKQVNEAKLIGSLNVDLYDEGSYQLDVDYTDELVYALKRNLKLPEYGKVDIVLQLSSKGSIISFKIERAKSSLNKAYVESHLPKIKFAPFSGSLAKKSEFTFHISLTNDE